MFSRYIRCDAISTRIPSAINSHVVFRIEQRLFSSNRTLSGSYWVTYSGLMQYHRACRLVPTEHPLSLQNAHVDHRHFLQALSILTDLLVFVFASILKNIPITEPSAPGTLSARALPDAKSAEMYQLRLILFPDGEKLLNIYDQCAINGEFPMSESISAALDHLLDERIMLSHDLFDMFSSSLARVFGTMALIDLQNQALVPGCSDFIQKLSQYLGRNFWKLKVSAIDDHLVIERRARLCQHVDQTYLCCRLITGRSTESRSAKECFATVCDLYYLIARFVLYATGILCAWTTEQEQAELAQYLYDALLLVANYKLSIEILVVIYTEIGSVSVFGNRSSECISNDPLDPIDIFKMICWMFSVIRWPIPIPKFAYVSFNYSM